MNKLLNSNDRFNMLEGILDWLSANLDSFQTPVEDDIVGVVAENIKADISRKAFIELGLALRLAQRSSFLRTHPKVEKLREAWISIVESQNFFFDCRRRIQLYPHRVVAFSVLKSFGIYEKDVFDDLQVVLNRGYLDRIERSSWDKLDMKYYIEACDLKHGFPDNSKLLSDSSLLNLPQLSYVQNVDLYALTHLLFHFSDFGSVDMKRFLGNEYQNIQDYVNLTMSMSIIKQDWDLTAELLINQFCLQKQFTDVDRDTASILCKSQQSSGFIPGRDWVKQRNESKSNQHHTPAFNDVYHPTIVCLILLDCEFINN
jgi:hypothetical protein